MTENNSIRALIDKSTLIPLSIVGIIVIFLSSILLWASTVRADINVNSLQIKNHEKLIEKMHRENRDDHQLILKKIDELRIGLK